MAENYIDKIEVDGVERPIRDTSGSVRYDEAQSLSDAQKAQARGNINAAPGGFGIGETPKYIADANDAVKNGRYAIDESTLNLPGSTGSLWDYTYLDVYAGSRPDVYIKQTITSPYQVWHQCEVTRCFYSVRGGWQPWEWINPPMELGVEYRTTERYFGKPVYAKLVDCGTIPAQGTNKTIVFSPDEINGIVSIGAYSPMRGTTLPYYDANGVRYSIAGNGNTIMIWNYSESQLDTNVNALIKYIKTAD